MPQPPGLTLLLYATSRWFLVSIESGRQAVARRDRKKGDGLICMSSVVRPYTTASTRQPGDLRRRSGFNILLACRGRRHLVGNTAARHMLRVPPRLEYQSTTSRRCLSVSRMPPGNHFTIAGDLKLILNAGRIGRSPCTHRFRVIFQIHHIS